MKSEIQLFLLLALYIFVITILKLRVCSKHLYFSDLSNVSLSSELFMYADDDDNFSQILSFDALATCSALNIDLKSIAEWSTNNALHLNPFKSSC